MSLTKSQIFFRIMNLWFLFSGFLYANIFFHAGDRYPVNIFTSYFFLIVLPLILFLIGLFARFRKKTEGFTLFKKISKDLKENLDTSLLKSEFYLNGFLFSLGGLFSLLLKMLLTKIFFGWDFLFNLSPGFIMFFTDIISFPWSWLWEGAHPTLELISNTQFMEMNFDFYFEQIKSTREMKGIGDWRAFFLASYLCYGLIPRFILWGYHFRKRSKL